MKDVNLDQKSLRILAEIGFIDHTSDFCRAFLDDMVDSWRNRISRERPLGNLSKIKWQERQAVSRAYEYLRPLGRGDRYWGKRQPLRCARIEYPRDTAWYVIIFYNPY